MSTLLTDSKVIKTAKKPGLLTLPRSKHTLLRIENAQLS